MHTIQKFYIDTKLNLDILRTETSEEIFNNFREIADDIVHYCMNNNLSYSHLNRSGKLYIHLVNVSILSVKLGMDLGLSLSELKLLSLGGLLHDIGKLHIPSNILNKPAKLNAAERKEINKHVDFGLEFLPQDLQNSIVGDIVLKHHSVFNKDIIPYKDSVFLCGISDIVDAMLSFRPYKKPLPIGIVIEEVKNKGGDFLINHLKSMIEDDYGSCDMLSH